MVKRCKYPWAVDPAKVGTYPALTRSGGGYFFDEVLEYRVWCHPEAGAPDPDGEGEDYFHCFATHAEALAFHLETPGSEEPLVLVLQREHVNEPSPGRFVHVRKRRITEWRCEWLAGDPRRPGDIEAMIAEGARPRAEKRRR